MTGRSIVIVVWNLPDASDPIYQASAQFLADQEIEIRFTGSTGRMWSMVRRVLGAGRTAICWSGKGLVGDSIGYRQLIQQPRDAMVLDRPVGRIELLSISPTTTNIALVSSWLADGESDHGISPLQDLSDFVNEVEHYLDVARYPVLLFPIQEQSTPYQLPNPYHELIVARSQSAYSPSILLDRGYRIYRDVDYLVVSNKAYISSDTPGDPEIAFSSLGYAYHNPVVLDRLVHRKGVDLFVIPRPVIPLTSAPDVQILHISESTKMCAAPAGWSIMRWSDQSQMDTVRASYLWEAYRFGNQVIRDWIDHVVRLTTYGGVSIHGADITSIEPISTRSISVVLENSSDIELRYVEPDSSIMAGPPRMSSRDAAAWYTGMEAALAKIDPARTSQYLIHSESVDVLSRDVIRISHGLGSQSPAPVQTTPNAAPNRYSAQVPVHISQARQLQDPRGRYQFASN